MAVTKSPFRRLTPDRLLLQRLALMIVVLLPWVTLAPPPASAAPRDLAEIRTIQTAALSPASDVSPQADPALRDSDLFYRLCTSERRADILRCVRLIEAQSFSVRAIRVSYAPTRTGPDGTAIALASGQHDQDQARVLPVGRGFARYVAEPQRIRPGRALMAEAKRLKRDPQVYASAPWADETYQVDAWSDRPVLAALDTEIGDALRVSREVPRKEAVGGSDADGSFTSSQTQSPDRYPEASSAPGPDEQPTTTDAAIWHPPWAEAVR